MTAPLAGALVLSMVAAVSTSWLYIAWPRRMSAEEWIVHRRSFQRAHEATARGARFTVVGPRSTAEPRIRILTDADLAVLRLASPGMLSTHRAVLRRLGLIAGCSAMAVIVVLTGAGLALSAFASVAVAPLLGLVAGAAVACGQWLLWRFEAAQLRTAIRKNMPRVLTGARVLLDSGTSNAEQALAGAVGTYADPAAELLREALRQKEVRRIDFEAAVDEVADRYGIDELHRLADSLRVGHRYGTGMSALLADFAVASRGSWHATYRERITRAPVVMTVPALLFFVVPLLVLVMFLVFSPLVRALSRL